MHIQGLSLSPFLSSTAGHPHLVPCSVHSSTRLCSAVCPYKGFVCCSFPRRLHFSGLLFSICFISWRTNPHSNFSCFYLEDGGNSFLQTGNLTRSHSIVTIKTTIHISVAMKISNVTLYITVQEYLVNSSPVSLYSSHVTDKIELRNNVDCPNFHI